MKYVCFFPSVDFTFGKKRGFGRAGKLTVKMIIVKQSRYVSFYEQKKETFGLNQINSLQKNPANYSQQFNS